MKPEEQLEELRAWIQTQNINNISFEVRLPAPRIRAFKNGDSKDPSYTTIRKLQQYKKTKELENGSN